MENKELIRLLCRMLPYRLKCKCPIVSDETYELVNLNFGVDGLNFGSLRTTNGDYINCRIDEIKPILRTIDSMTDKEISTLFQILHVYEDGLSDDWIKINEATGIQLILCTGRYIEDIDDAIEYLCQIKIDYRGLINNGTALEADHETYN
jgi:hypothetical protein